MPDANFVKHEVVYRPTSLKNLSTTLGDRTYVGGRVMGKAVTRKTPTARGVKKKDNVSKERRTFFCSVAAYSCSEAP